MMKKVFALLLTLSVLSIVSAINFDLQSSLFLETNEGEVNLPTITIVLDSGTTLDTFDLVIADAEDFIFSPDISSSLTYTMSDDLKKINFEGSFQDTVEVTGLKIRTYDEKINAKIGLNWTGDEAVDTYTTRYIELDTDEDNDDNMKPLPVTNASYEIQDNTIVINRTTSADLDITKQIVRVLKDGNFVKDNFLTAGQTSFIVSDIDTEDHAYTIKIYAKDQYYSSEHVVLEIPKQEVEEKEDIQEEDLPEVYELQTDSAILEAIANIIDEKLDVHRDDLAGDQKIEARTARNDLLELMEGYLLGNISQQETSNSMTALLAQLLPYIN